MLLPLVLTAAAAVRMVFGGIIQLSILSSVPSSSATSRSHQFFSIGFLLPPTTTSLLFVPHTRRRGTLCFSSSSNNNKNPPLGYLLLSSSVYSTSREHDDTHHCHSFDAITNIDRRRQQPVLVDTTIPSSNHKKDCLALISESSSVAAAAAFNDCWNATTLSVNPNDVDSINQLLQCFHSPAPQVYFAFTRALAITSHNDCANNNNGSNSNKTTKDVLQLFSYVLKKGYKFQYKRNSGTQPNEGEDERRDLLLSQIKEQDDSRTQQSSDIAMEWRVVQPFNEGHNKNSIDRRSDWETIRMDMDFPSTLSIAHHLLERRQIYDPWTTPKNGGDDGAVTNAYSSTLLVQEAVSRLDLTLGVDIRGRASADTAFVFAMAGVDHPELYRLLTRISYHELKRIGRRPSFPSKRILQIVEKLAASGVQPRTGNSDNNVLYDDGNIKFKNVDVDAQRLYQLAGDLLSEKDDSARHDQVIRSLRAATAAPCRRNDTNFRLVVSSNQSMNIIQQRKLEDYDDDAKQSWKNVPRFGLHSTRSLLWLWRFAARQTKAPILQQAGQPPLQQYDSISWARKYRNSSFPLIVDLGCGMGVSLLGLSIMTPYEYNNETPVQKAIRHIAGSGQAYNYVGGDLDSLSINYARGIARRWGIDHRLQFVWKPSFDLLMDVIKSSYPSIGVEKRMVAMIMIQFPTPYRFLKEDVDKEVESLVYDDDSSVDIGNIEQPSSSNGGNRQLPSNKTTTFMANLQLFRLAATILQESNGYLLLQSNCEDVAVSMRQMAIDDVGFEYVDISELTSIDQLSCEGNNRHHDCGTLPKLPQRTREWMARGGERAIGPGWYGEPLLPINGRTETEVHCELNGIPIHRCLLRMKGVGSDLS
jgi:hypothetical protein